MDNKALVLHQFLASHYNEKVRWALDYKGLQHKRVDYLPGPHVPVIKQKSGGSTTTPLLQHGADYISNSALIIDWLETHYPHRALYPQDAVLKRQALNWQSRLDAELGPASRTAFFSVFLHEPQYLCATFGASKSRLKRMLYRGMYPVAKSVIAKAYRVQQQTDIDAAHATCHRFLDYIASVTRDNRYLVGDSFSVADLTAAALLAPLTSVSHPDMQRSEPMPDNVRTFLNQWQDHPAIAWVHSQYAEHRPTPGADRQET